MKSTARSARRVSLKRVLVYCVCVFLCTCAASCEVDDSAIVHVLPNSMLAIGMLVTSLILFRQVLFGGNPGLQPVAMVVSIIFGLFTVLGMQLDAYQHTLELAGLSIGTKEIASPVVCYAAMLIAFVGYSLFYYAAVSLLFEKLIHIKLKSDGPRTTILKRPISFPVCVTVLLLAWLPYIIYFFPGMPSSDTSRQIAQLFGTNGLTLDTHFPFMTSALFGGLYRLGCEFDPSGYLGIFLMTGTQAAFGAFVFSSVVVWLDRLGADRKLVIGALAFFALFPLVPVYTVKIEKDTLHAELLVLLALQIILLFKLKRDGKNAPWLATPLAIGIVCLLVSLTRNNGIFLAVAALAVTAILARRKTLWAALGCTVTAFCIWQIVLLPLFGVSDEGPREALSMPAQIVSSHVQDDLPLREQDEAALLETCENLYEEMGEFYNPVYADHVKARLEIDSADDMSKFLEAVIHVSAQQPLHALSAALATAYGAWYPFCYGTYHDEDHPFLNSADEPRWANIQWFDSTEDIPIMEQNTRIGRMALHGLHSVPVLSVLYTPGFYLWFAILIAGFSLYCKKDRRLTMSVLAMFFLLSLVMVFGPCSSLRYSLPYVFSLPILIYLLLNCIQARSDI